MHPPISHRSIARAMRRPLTRWSTQTTVVVLCLLSRAVPLEAQRPSPPTVSARFSAPYGKAARGVSHSTLTDRSGSRRVWKGAGLGLLAGAVTGVIVGAVYESRNKGGDPAVRDRYKGFAHGIFVPLGAAVGAAAGALIGAIQ